MKINLHLPSLYASLVRIIRDETPQMGSMNSQGDTFLLLLARCKWREDDHFHIHRSGLGALYMDIPLDPKRVGERVSMETSDKWRILSKKDNGDIQGNRYCAHGVLKKGAPAARRCASVAQTQYHIPSPLQTVAPPACLFERTVKKHHTFFLTLFQIRNCGDAHEKFEWR